MQRLWPLLAAVVCLGLGCARTSAPASTLSPIAIEAQLANRFVRAGASAKAVARLVVSARPAAGEAPPANIALVVDTSGSMEGKAIEDARDAAVALLDALKPKDRLAVVVFHSQTEVLLASTKVGDVDLADVRARLRA